MIAQLDATQIKIRPSRALARLVSHVSLQGRPLTTKGRWINSLIFSQFSLVKKLPKLRPVIKPIFILGTGRSGTTILGTVLSLHPSICFLNEPKALWHSIHPEEDLIGSYSRRAARYYLYPEDASKEVIQAAHKLYGYSLAVTHSERILDKYPELIFRLPFIKKIFPDAKFIFLVRNGWDTINSIARWSERESIEVNGEIHNWWGVNNRKWHFILNDLVQGNPLFAGREMKIKNLENQIDMAAVEWIVTMHEGIVQFQNQTDNTYLLHYEDLVEDPRQSLTKLLAFCELAPDEKLLAYASKRLTRPASYRPTSLDASIADLFEHQMKVVTEIKVKTL